MYVKAHFCPAMSRYGHSLLEEARDENHKMRDTILGLQEQLANMERERNVMQHQLRLKSTSGFRVNLGTEYGQILSDFKQMRSQ